MAMKYKSRHLKLPDSAVFRLSGVIEDDERNSPKTCRQKLGMTLNRPCTQTLVVAFVFTDLLIISVLLLIDLKAIRVPPGSSNSNYESTESVNGDSDILELLEVIFHDLQLAVISLFLLEVLLRIVAQSVDMLDDRWQIFDCLVVLVTFALYVALTIVVKGRTFTYPSGYVVVLRLWRIPRIYHAIVWPYHCRVSSEAIAHKKTIKFAEENLHVTQQKLMQQQSEIEYLKEQLRKTYAARMNDHSQYCEVEASITGENPDPTTTTHTEQPHPDPAQDVNVTRFHLYAPNGAIFSSHTPHSSLSSTIFPVISLPGTPQSVASSRHTDDPPDGATERYPDLVEGTHSTVVIGDVGRASSDPNLFCSSSERTYKDKHKSSRSDDGLQEGETIPSINSVRLVNNTRDNNTETSITDAKRQIAKEDKDEKAETSPSVVPRVVLSLPGASVTSTVFICDVTNGDDEKLIPVIPEGESLGVVYVNEAFSCPPMPPPSPVPTEEDEEQEILRISQVPFHLVDSSCGETHLEEGIPMTDL